MAGIRDLTLILGLAGAVVSGDPSAADDSGRHAEAGAFAQLLEAAQQAVPGGVLIDAQASERAGKPVLDFLFLRDGVDLVSVEIETETGRIAGIHGNGSDAPGGPSGSASPGARGAGGQPGGPGSEAGAGPGGSPGGGPGAGPGGAGPGGGGPGGGGPGGGGGGGGSGR
ncbi:hypothetical protein [Paralimibaculum aggregatum]|nr:hypothetical protein [Limibaculum sp. NKW23]